MNKLYRWLVLAVAVAGIGTLLFSGNAFAGDPVVGLTGTTHTYQRQKSFVPDQSTTATGGNYKEGDVLYMSSNGEKCGGTEACKGIHLRVTFLANNRVTLATYRGDKLESTIGTGEFDASKRTVKILGADTSKKETYETIYTFHAGMTRVADISNKKTNTATGDTNWGNTKIDENGYQVELSTGWSSGSSSYQTVTEFVWVNGRQLIKSEKVTDNRSAKPIEKLQLFVRDAQGRPTQTINVWSYYSPTSGEYSNYVVENYDYDAGVMERYEGVPQAHGNFASLANQAKTNSQALVITAKTGYRQSITGVKVGMRRGVTYTLAGSRTTLKYDPDQKKWIPA